MLILSSKETRLGGGIGRHAGLKILWHCPFSTRDITTSGTFVIVDHSGTIKLSGDATMDYPTIVMGSLAKKKNILYDLSTGNPIGICSGESIKGKNSYIFTHAYNWNKFPDGTDFPLGIYKIRSLETGLVLTKVDDVY